MGDAQSRCRFDELLNDFCILWVLCFPGRVNDVLLTALGFFDSKVATLRAAAAALCGVVLKHVPAADLPRINAEQVLSVLMQHALGREDNALVRQRCAQAVGLLPVV